MHGPMHALIGSELCALRAAEIRERGRRDARIDTSRPRRPLPRRADD